MFRFAVHFWPSLPAGKPRNQAKLNTSPGAVSNLGLRIPVDVDIRNKFKEVLSYIE